MFALRTYIAAIPLFAALAVFSSGCFMSRRVCVTADVPKLDTRVKTANRYEIIGHGINDTAKRKFPGVFADGGIPIILKEELECNNGPNIILGPLPLFLPIPDRQSQRMIRRDTVEIAGTPTLQSSFTLQTKYDNSTSFWLPTAFLCFMGSGSDAENPHFDAHLRTFCKVNAPVTFHETIASAELDITIRAVASKLKQAEDAGMITSDVIDKALVYKRQLDAKRREETEQAWRRDIALKARQAEDRKRREFETRQRQLALQQKRRETAIGQTLQHPQQSPAAHQAPYRIHYLAREKDSDFAYAFTLELSGEASIETFFGIQAVFANEVLSAYQMEYQKADVSTLHVVVKPALLEGRIVGRAEVLTIMPVSLSYNPNTRHGRLAVRYSQCQYEEAREWARKNIETLARDKNISLVTGRPPPDARYYSLGETVKDGNILEIEFKTE